MDQTKWRMGKFDLLLIFFSPSYLVVTFCVRTPRDIVCFSYGSISSFAYIRVSRISNENNEAASCWFTFSEI